jgi:hypothetical protein
MTVLYNREHKCEFVKKKKNISVQNLATKHCTQQIFKLTFLKVQKSVSVKTRP